MEFNKASWEWGDQNVQLDSKAADGFKDSWRISELQDKDTFTWMPRENNTYIIHVLLPWKSN